MCVRNDKVCFSTASGVDECASRANLWFLQEERNESAYPTTCCLSIRYVGHVMSQSSRRQAGSHRLATDTNPVKCHYAMRGNDYSKMLLY